MLFLLSVISFFICYIAQTKYARPHSFLYHVVLDLALKYEVWIMEAPKHYPEVSQDQHYIYHDNHRYLLHFENHFVPI